MNNWWRKNKEEKSKFQKEIEEGARDYFFINEYGMVDWVHNDEKELDDGEEDLLQHQ